MNLYISIINNGIVTFIIYVILHTFLQCKQSSFVLRFANERHPTSTRLDKALRAMSRI